MILFEQRKLTTEEIQDAIDEYEGSATYRRILKYSEYYEGRNPELRDRVEDREYRKKNPNWFIPTAYFSTTVDGMAGYMGNSVLYTSPTENAQKIMNEVLKENQQDVKDMKTLIYTLAYNRGYELVYTTGDGENTPEVKYTTLDPKQCIPVYSQDIEKTLYALIWKRTSPEKDYQFYVDVFYSDLQETYKIKDEVYTERDTPRQLFFDRCPAVEYRAELIGDQSPFHVVLPYIAALDWVITGNSNDMDRLVDSLLVLGKKIHPDDADHMDEWKFLEDFSKEMRAEFLTKEMSPEFRKYVSELLINEIHKHSHVIDWYNADTAGDASAKALKTRLFDMDMYSQRLEKVYKNGIYQRLNLLSQIINKRDLATNEDFSDIVVKMERTIPTDNETKMESFKNVDWYSNQTKVEQTGGNWEIEKERLEEEAPEIDLDAFSEGE